MGFRLHSDWIGLVREPFWIGHIRETSLDEGFPIPSHVISNMLIPQIPNRRSEILSRTRQAKCDCLETCSDQRVPNSPYGQDYIESVQRKKLRKNPSSKGQSPSPKKTWTMAAEQDGMTQKRQSHLTRFLCYQRPRAYDLHWDKWRYRTILWILKLFYLLNPFPDDK